MLDWIYRFAPIPKLNIKTGHLATPRCFGLGPESALGSCPRVALSSAQATGILIDGFQTVVALITIEGVEHLVPNVCTVAGFEVITIGRF